MAKFEWSDDLSVKIASIDSQHKKLIGMLNQMHEALVAGKAWSNLEGLLNELIAYTKEHFGQEEKYFSEFSYPAEQKHIEQHQEFIAKVAEFQKKYESEDMSLSLEISTFLQEWLKDHIQGSDQEYSEFLISKGVS